MRLRKLSIALAASAVGVAALGAIPALGADHRDAPLTTANPKIDINDVYAWTTGSGNLVLAMTVNPLTSPADTARLMLDPDANYELKLDTNGDGLPDSAIKFTFSGNTPVQDFSVWFATGSDAVANTRAGVLVTTGKTSAGSAVNVVSTPDGGKAFVGPRDDPFFFDLAGFQAGLKFTGVDTFKGTNVTILAIEISKATAASLAPSGKLGVWGTTSKKDVYGDWIQLDRMGRPAINTVFVPKEKKDRYNQNTPDRDKSIYTADFVASLKALGAGPDLASVLLPDILTIDMTKPTKYLNGRAPADDVIDISLAAITGNAAAGDGVNANDRPFLTEFPYFAAPNPQTAPGAPNTGTIASTESGNDFAWTLPAGLVAGGLLLGAAGFTSRRRKDEQV